ncbi:histidine phosphatase family protein [Puniceicoccus vermicola]|uniref:Histidine phosphatase family protein n=1 Tax=Puniceicoccus vermicola TaxID=388746 RepID=A0A7X1B0S6_9BACT|nr:histidine phosphatase family protein [Puniceicoccus vermicola]MBC2603467.1 histidine phosphatase family protein [Puniceicoccus vermicola]
MSEDTQKKVFLFRHGETEWSRSGQHTSITDLPLTANGRDDAKALKPVVELCDFSLILSSPRKRAKETAELAGVGDRMEIDEDLAEWFYGDYEGMTTSEIREKVPGWNIFTHPVPGGETGEEVAARCDRVIQRVLEASGDVALFAHGHLLRVFTVRWLRLGPSEGRHFVIHTGSLIRLGYEHENRAIEIWNAPVDR